MLFCVLIFTVLLSIVIISELLLAFGRIFPSLELAAEV